MSSLKDIVLSLAVGAAVGFVISKLNLPVPAPNTLAAVMGVVGVWLGSFIANRV